MAAASTVGIWNRALQLLGAERVESITQTSRNANSCRACYEPIRDALLEETVWRFSILQATIAADSPAPDWGKANSFTLPTDYIMLAPDFPEEASLDRDYEVQDGKIFSDFAAPLYIRYVSKVSDPAKMPASFRELVSTKMADAMCEEITQSNQKKVAMERAVEAAYKVARRANARQSLSQEPPTSSWISVRD